MLIIIKLPHRPAVSRLMCDHLQTCWDHFSLLSLAFPPFPILLCLHFCCDIHGWKTFLVKSIQWFHARANGDIPPLTAVSHLLQTQLEIVPTSPKNHFNVETKMAEKSRDILLKVSSGFTLTIVEAPPQTAVPWSSQTRLENVLASPENYLVVSRITLLKRRLNLRSLV